jgi:excinuclease ABC subunit C
MEMLRRRCECGIREDDFPDLIVVDGGIAQLNAALEVWREMELEWSRVPVVALAKRRPPGEGEEPSGQVASERVYLPGRRNPVLLKPGSAPFRLLVALRDATHRAALGYHSQVSRATRIAGLEQIVGLGPARRARLLGAFPDPREAAQVPLATLVERARIPRSTAARVQDWLRRLQSEASLATL